ncbi:uncharacterized protein LOC126291430 [Schistocerca gregaria]|uniref:uncharacterized protein LOC126291430 n=1 Tax=Schistocerca gregaria TaxID=7010 RepID=UPI00211DB4FF|nr:uncharacterized protein LOC126291430 [Schistocerca gregaria]
MAGPSEGGYGNKKSHLGNSPERSMFHQRYSYTAMATAGSLFLVIIILLLIIMPTIKRQNSLKTRSPYRPDKPRGSGKRTPNKRHNSVRHVTGERKPTDYGNIGYTAVNVDPLEEELYHQTYGDGAHLSRPEIIQRSKVQIANEVNRLVDEAAARVVQEQQLGRHKKYRSPFVPRHTKIDLLGIQTPTVPVYDNSQDHVGYREWKADSKQKKHRRSKESHTRNRVYRDYKVHDEELGKRHTDSQKEHVREESPQRRDVKRQDSFISSLGLIVEEDENGQEDGLQTQTVQDAQPWNKESISSFFLPQSTDESDIVRKQAPSPPPPDF